MKVSLITATYNSESTILPAIFSVNSQTYGDIEHVFIDGSSLDNTVELINRHSKRCPRVYSEPDDGIYFALNKGLALSTGDIVGFVHSDDQLADNNILEKVVSVFDENHDVNFVYGDLCYVSKKSRKIVRYWKSKPYGIRDIERGWMPPHPSVFVRRDLLSELGYYNTDYKISSDYEFIVRLLRHTKANGYYIPYVISNMNTGGASNKSLQAIFSKTIEDFNIIKLHRLGIMALLYKNFSKIIQFFERPY